MLLFCDRLGSDRVRGLSSAAKLVNDDSMAAPSFAMRVAILLLEQRERKRVNLEPCCALVTMPIPNIRLEGAFDISKVAERLHHVGIDTLFARDMSWTNGVAVAASVLQYRVRGSIMRNVHSEIRNSPLQMLRATVIQAVFRE